jgi:hypothetical protein
LELIVAETKRHRYATHTKQIANGVITAAEALVSFYFCFFLRIISLTDALRQSKTVPPKNCNGKDASAL